MIKLNGGLGTGMGLQKAKSLLDVRGGETFLDLIAKQVLHLRADAWGRLAVPADGQLLDERRHGRLSLRALPRLGGAEQWELMQNRVPKIERASAGARVLRGRPGQRVVPAGARRPLPVARRFGLARPAARCGGHLRFRLEL